ncbi:hypothetical protein DBV15_09968 [Temnothorax longispinosus]|uniref:Uncharacterized protein n=1 Tax=Temnothorax longispinosus TaxID=300112 RepID=A0A4S2KFK6_9HYME|nr:hypothetical protein DBV15_09968 [Temnothorax longispinosus]
MVVAVEGDRRPQRGDRVSRMCDGEARFACFEIPLLREMRFTPYHPEECGIMRIVEEYRARVDRCPPRKSSCYLCAAVLPSPGL